MKVQNFFLLLAPLVVPITADCFRSGDGWDGTEASAREAVAKWCKKGLSGYYYPGERKQRCNNLNNGGSKPADKRVNLIVEWQGKAEFTLSEADCVRRLTEEIVGCPRGGVKTTADWKFTSDPNNGSCP